MSQGLSVKDVGPIRELEIPITQGGVTVLSGPNGSGKSTAIRAVSTAATGKNAGLTPRDGRPAGTLSVPGCTIRVGARLTKRGKPEQPYAVVEDGVGLARLIDPGIKDPVAADRRRLEALMDAIGAEPSEEALREFLGDDLVGEFLSDSGGVSGSLVDSVSELKRWLEKKARVFEDEVGFATGSIQEIGVLPEPVEEPVDRNELWNHVVKSENALNDARSRREASLEASRLVEQMGDLESIESLTESLESAKACVERRTAMIAGFEKQIEDLKLSIQIEKDQINVDEASIGVIQNQISQHEKRVELKQKIENTVTEQGIADIELTLAQARKQHDEAVVAERQQEDAAQKRNRLAELKSRREQAEAAGETCRGLATTVATLFRSALQGFDGWSVDDDLRLCVPHSRGEAVPFGDLSPGERAARAIQAVVSSVIRQANGEVPVVSLPQEVWESLDEDGRQMVVGIAKQENVAVVTAEASRSTGASGIEVKRYE